MERLEPEKPRNVLDALHPYVTNHELTQAMAEWCHRHMKSWPFEDWIDHPMFMGYIRLLQTSDILVDLVDLMLKVREIADNSRPSEATPQIVELIDAWDVPFEFKPSRER
jgi:hypothetical protein